MGRRTQVLARWTLLASASLGLVSPTILGYAKLLAKFFEKLLGINIDNNKNLTKDRW